MKPPAKIVRTYCEDYVIMLSALPATSAECAERTGFPVSRVRTALRNLRRLGVLRSEARKQGKQHPLFYSLGADQPELFRIAAGARASKPPSKMDSLAAVLSMLEEPVGAAEISALTGTDHRTVVQAIATLRKHGLVRIAGWERDGRTCSARFCLGRETDAKKPPKMTRSEINRRYRESRRDKRFQVDLMRRICGVAAVNDEPQQVAA